MAKYHACSHRFRVYNSGSRKADAIYTNKAATVASLRTDRANIVCEYYSNHKVNEWLVSWMGDHWKWDPCFSDSDR